MILSSFGSLYRELLSGANFDHIGVGTFVIFGKIDCFSAWPVAAADAVSGCTPSLRFARQLSRSSAASRFDDREFWILEYARLADCLV